MLASTRLTVAVETPARRATSRMVAGAARSVIAARGGASSRGSVNDFAALGHRPARAPVARARRCPRRSGREGWRRMTARDRGRALHAGLVTVLARQTAARDGGLVAGRPRG